MGGKIGIVGLGRIGMPAAKKFAEVGYEVFAHDRRPEASAEMEAAGGRHVGSPREVAENADTVIVLVLNDQQVIDVVTGRDGLLDGAGEGSTIVCMSTINRENLVRVADTCASRGVRLVDCPFTGGAPRIPKGNLTLIMAAPKDVVESVRPVMAVIGNVNHVGETPGQGQAVKHCNQLLVGTTHAATMEVIALARKLGLDPRQVCEIVGSGVGGSDYFRLLTEAVLDGKPSPGGIGQMAKDLAIVVNTGRRCKAPLYVATAASQYFVIAEAMGMQNAEGADLIKVVERVNAPERTPQ
jgi:3-hydroxyisobutyrate dehydrogenase-like beta-hydroxyacid dehydrogenase